MNSRTFTKRVNKVLEEVIEDTLRYEQDHNYRKIGMNPFVDVNKSRIWLCNGSKKDHTIKFMCVFNPEESLPKDIAKFVLFGLTINHVIEIVNDKTGISRYFKIENVEYANDSSYSGYSYNNKQTYLLVTVEETIGLETDTLPSGQTVYKPILPQ